MSYRTDGFLCHARIGFIFCGLKTALTLVSVNIASHLKSVGASMEPLQMTFGDNILVTRAKRRAMRM